MERHETGHAMGGPWEPLFCKEAWPAAIQVEKPGQIMGPIEFELDSRRV